MITFHDHTACFTIEEIFIPKGYSAGSSLPHSQPLFTPRVASAHHYHNRWGLPTQNPEAPSF
jgi:hypothetical protein